MFYQFVRFLSCVVFHTAFRTQVSGRSRIPPTGPLLIVSNHRSFADPLLIGWLARRPVEFMAMAELFHHPFWGPVVRHLNSFPIDRTRHDHGAAREAARRLRHGRCVGIFPEGGIRTEDKPLHAIKDGAALIAQLTGAAVLPTVVRDTHQFHDWRRWFRGGRMSVTFGYPFCIIARDRAAARDVLVAQLLKTVELE